jgi:hypothetical protein
MVCNQDLSRYNTADIEESYRRWKENKNIATNSENIAKNSKSVCSLNRVSFNGIANRRITAKLWGQR